MTILTAIFVLVICGAASATSYTDLYVSPTGNDSYSGNDSLHPAQTIGHALTYVNDGSTVHLANGIYSGTGNTNLTINKNMAIKGQSQTGTIINGTGTNWIFQITSGINVTIVNLTLTNGTWTNAGGAIHSNGNLNVKNVTFTDNTANDGGAIENYNGNLTVTGSTFTGNTANYNGGAIHNDHSNLTVTNCIFTNNNASSAFNGGGAIHSDFSNCTITGSTFTNNSATHSGGAIINNDGGNLTITNSNFTGNKATYGGAIITNGALTVTSSTFTGNNATDLGGAIYSEGISNVHFNRIVGNNASQGSDVYLGIGTIDAKYNWWGSNNGPDTTKIHGTVDSSRWLILTLNITSPVQTNSNSKITADLRYDNTGVLHTEAYLPNGILVSFTTNLGTIGSQSTTVNGIAKTTLKSSELGSANILTKLDNQTLNKSIKIVDIIPPKVTSTYPKKNSKNVSRTKKITIKFSEKIKKSSKWSKVYVKNKYGKKVKISKSISGKYLYIKTAKKSSQSYYTVYIPASAVKDYAGNKLAKKYTYKFKTKK